jgi:chorismate mutase/prephenate dehydratase
LPILHQDIEDSSANTTRFLVLGKQVVRQTGNDKTSLVCSVPNEPGMLHCVLSIFANAGINLTKLESRPAPSGVWDYVFFIDIEGHEADERVLHAFDELHAQAVFVKILGSYPKGA